MESSLYKMLNARTASGERVFSWYKRCGAQYAAAQHAAHGSDIHGAACVGPSLLPEQQLPCSPSCNACQCHPYH